MVGRKGERGGSGVNRHALAASAAAPPLPTILNATPGIRPQTDSLIINPCPTIQSLDALVQDSYDPAVLG